MMPIAYRGLRHLGDQRLGVAQQEVHGRAETPELILKQSGLEPESVSRALIARLSGRAPTLAIAPRMLPAEQTPVCKHFKLHLQLAIEWLTVRLERNDKRAPYRE
jgi:hypothetical protein